MWSVAEPFRGDFVSKQLGESLVEHRLRARYFEGYEVSRSKVLEIRRKRQTSSRSGRYALVSDSLVRKNFADKERAKISPCRVYRITGCYFGQIDQQNE